MKKAFVVSILVITILAGCSSGSPISTATETPTSTLIPTITPSPSSTTTPTITQTQTPTPTMTPSPTPKGSGMGYLAYVKDVKSDTKAENGEDAYVSNIYIYDFSTNQETQITKNQKNTELFLYADVNWSPDGSRLVFSIATATLKGSDGSRYWNSIIYTMKTDGTDLRKISTLPQFAGNLAAEDVVQEYRPSFIDNEKILFVSNRKNLQNFQYEKKRPYILDTLTLEVIPAFTTYLEIDFISMNPDKSRITFMATDGDSEIFIADLTKKDAITQITKNTFADRFPSFSRNGEWIVFHSDRDGNVELYIMKPDGSEVKRITTNPATDATASFSPDGNWLSFYSDQTGDMEAYIQNIATGERIQITDSSNPVSYVRWSP